MIYIIILFILGGEELFGFSVNEYPELQRIRRELGLLQKLYSLYNSVINTVNSYFDILWSEIDIEKIALEVQEFQNRYAMLLAIIFSNYFSVFLYCFCLSKSKALHYYVDLGSGDKLLQEVRVRSGNINV